MQFGNFIAKIAEKRREFFEFATRKVLSKASTESPRCECAWAIKMFLRFAQNRNRYSALRFAKNCLGVLRPNPEIPAHFVPGKTAAG